MKFSIITSVLNNYPFIQKAVESVQGQREAEYEHLIIDGGSTDDTKGYIDSLKDKPEIKVLSEKDKGIYDALNKGMKLAQGDIIGLLHSDDLFADQDCLASIHQEFEKGADAVYGDLNYVLKHDTNKIIRKWVSCPYDESSLPYGWMPPHPAFFFKKDLLQKVGEYSLDFSIAADYEFMLRILNIKDLKVSYVPKVITKMRLGGKSNRSIRNIMNKSREDFVVAKKFFKFPLLTVLAKNLRKINQIRF